MFSKSKKNKCSIKSESQFSSFVIDLRRTESTILKSANKKSNRKLSSSLSHFLDLNNRVKGIKTNFIFSNKFKDKILLSNYSWLAFFRKVIRFNPLVIFDFKKVLPRRVNEPWLGLIEEKQSYFNIRPRINFKKRNINKTEVFEKDRLARAENTVVWYRSLLSFTIVLILLILPFKLLSYFSVFDFSVLGAKVKESSELALENLTSAANSASQLNFKQADIDFRAAGQNFLEASENLNKVNDSLFIFASLSSNPKLKFASESKQILQAGAIASSLGQNLMLATDSLFSGNKNNFSLNFDNFLKFGHLAVNDSTNLNKAISKIGVKNLPLEYQDKFIALSTQSQLLADNLENFISLGDKFKEVLGLSRDKRYLLVFQNNAELRASGGFLGSYALVDFRDGAIRNIEVPGGGSYDTEGGMDIRVAAPKPLWLVNPIWHFWDANWWPDWPTTAQNLMWFYEHSGGSSVDGVITFTPTVIERLLEVSGPIDLTKEYGVTINSNNFWETTQKITEKKNLLKSNPDSVATILDSHEAIKTDLPMKQGLELNPNNKPKKIIGDLMAKILEVLPQKINQANLVTILDIFRESMLEKQIMFYFTDSKLERETLNRNWGGEIQEATKDYLLIVNTNIAGQKSDRLVDEKIEETVQVEPDGTILKTLKIQRIHNGIKNEPLTGVRNVDWLRVYVPLGSELISADGFSVPEIKFFKKAPDFSLDDMSILAAENDAAVDPSSGTKIYSEKNKTVFANWTMVDPGQVSVVTLKYRLPFNFFEDIKTNNWWNQINQWLNPESADTYLYSLLAQKQPGVKASEFVSHLILPTNCQVFWRYPENIISNNGWKISDQLSTDKLWSVLVKRNK